MRRLAWILLVIPLIGVVGKLEAQQDSWGNSILSETFGFSASTPSDVPWEEVLQGCPQRDCIRSIDKPTFVSAEQATFLEPNDIVIALEIDGVSRAYPTRILVFHEIVNDSINGNPVLVSYCPLCGSGIIFNRQLGAETVTFGVSGLLHNSDLIMYDRKTDSLWQQITATSFAGPSRGEKLAIVPSSMTTWSKWRSAHPDTRVLSTNTGFSKMNYGASPYGDYATNERLMFPVSLSDARRHPKMVVYGAVVQGQPVAYSSDYIQKHRAFTDELGGKTVQVEYANDGQVTLSDKDGGRWTGSRMFWFAWYTFHPDTLLREDG